MPLHKVHVHVYTCYKMCMYMYLLHRRDVSKGSTLRSLESMQTCASLNPSRPAKQRLGSKHTPLLRIEPDHIIPDELHLLLRVMDVLLRNLIWEMVWRDHAAYERGGDHGTFLQQLVEAVKSCGISFKVGKNCSVHVNTLLRTCTHTHVYVHVYQWMISIRFGRQGTLMVGHQGNTNGHR